jgi:GNAT superfamily N-acetyltransferase
MGRMQQSELTVRRTTEADWPAVRDLRLEMVQDTPIAFGETYETALAVPESEWRMRAARGSSPNSLGLAAIVDERWVGTMGAYVPAGSGALLVGVYVTPDFRGSSAGVADALLGRVEEWARERGTTLTLHVHSQNTRARTFYARRGFVDTGQTFPYVLAPTDFEHEMIKQLD